MKSLKIPEGKYTLKVNFDAETGFLEMAGVSYPENTLDFFQPLFDWVKIYISEVRRKIVLNLKINYLNTSSTKCVLDILEILERYYIESGQVEVRWYYDKNDEDIRETGEGIAEDIALPFNIIKY